MTPHEQQQIAELFQQLQQMERESPPRDPPAEALIHQCILRQPTAPYYMTQLLLLQKQSLANARQQTDDLKTQLDHQARRQMDQTDDSDPVGAGTSFLAGAAQAALAIGGGLLLADFVSGAVDAFFEGEEDGTYSEDVLAVEDDESWI